MARIETWLRCDLQKAVEVIPLKGHLFAGDENANLIGVEITNRGIPQAVSGTLYVYGMRHDGVTVREQANITNTNRPGIALTHDFYTVIGPITLTLRLVSGNDETVLAACTTYVYETTTSQLIDSGSVLPTIESLVEKINACERAATAANEAASNVQTAVDAAAASAQDAADAAAAALQQAQSAAGSAQSAATAAQAAQSQAGQAASAASGAASQATTAARQAANAATQAANAAQSAQDAAGSANTAQQQVQAVQTSVSTAQAAASAALTRAQNAEASAQAAANSASAAATSATNAEQLAQQANTLNSQLSTTLSGMIPTIVQGGEVRNDALYLLNGSGEVVAGPFSGFGGGGGGGGSSSVRIQFVSTNGLYSFSVRNDEDVYISMTWSSTEDDEPTGNGTLNLAVNGVTKFTNKGVAQGVIRENVTSYLVDGDNTLTFQLTDAYGNRRTRSFTVTVLNLRIASNFDDSEDQYDAFPFTYTPYGNLVKTMHFAIDGTDVATATVSGYGRQLTQTIPAQSHGPHVLTVWFTGELNGETVSSNILRYEITCIQSGNDNVIITSSYNVSEVDQYATVNIPYKVYTPNSQTSDVEIRINGVTVNQLTGVDRTRHIFSYRLDDYGATTISIISGNAVKIILLTVNEVTVGAVAATEGLRLYLSSQGRSNNEANPGTWVSDQNGIQVSCHFTGFNWINDGWVLDDDGITCMRVSGDARIEIPYKPFQTDKRATGFTIEVDFATRDVLNYDSVIFSCLNGGRGFQMTSQSSELSSMGSRLSTKFKENEHVRVAFVVEKRTANRLVYCYINGIASAVIQYDAAAEMENFAQAVPQNITIGSNYATIDLYTIRIYDNDLVMKEVEDNWIADTPDGELMLTRFGRNNVRDENDMIRIPKLPSDLPYMIITAPVLPQYKGDKKTCSGSYTDPIQPNKSFTFENCEIDVQGTSSQYYARKNYKMKFNGGFTDSSGNTASKYKMRDDSIAVKTFCMKADVASSEGANNVELVRLYEAACPYKTPAQLENSKVRQGIDGFPIVIFWNNPNTNETTFLGKYNFNNDKGTSDVFGFVSGDESWEIRNNTNNRVLWRSDDYESMGLDDDGNVVPAWTLDFEARYPDTKPAYQDYTQLKELATFLKSTDPTQATDEALSESVTYPSKIVRTIRIDDPETGAISYVEAYENTTVTYTTDSAAYRQAKFKNEIGNYVEMQSALFYYIFTELFLMVDSRAKNAFPSFMGTVIGGNENE